MHLHICPTAHPRTSANPHVRACAQVHWLPHWAFLLDWRSTGAKVVILGGSVTATARWSVVDAGLRGRSLSSSTALAKFPRTVGALGGAGRHHRGSAQVRSRDLAMVHHRASAGSRRRDVAMPHNRTIEQLQLRICAFAQECGLAIAHVCACAHARLRALAVARSCVNALARLCTGAPAHQRTCAFEVGFCRDLCDRKRKGRLAPPLCVESPL